MQFINKMCLCALNVGQWREDDALTCGHGVTFEVSAKLDILHCAEVSVIQADAVVCVHDAELPSPAMCSAEEEHCVVPCLLVVLSVWLLRDREGIASDLFQYSRDRNGCCAEDTTLLYMSRGFLSRARIKVKTCHIRRIKYQASFRFSENLNIKG